MTDVWAFFFAQYCRSEWKVNVQEDSLADVCVTPLVGRGPRSVARKCSKALFG